MPANTQVGLQKSSQKDKINWEFGNYGANSNGKLRIERDKLVISTQNTRHCFFESDFYSFAYQKQSFPYDDCSKSTVTVKIGSLRTGSAGIMMRSGIRLDAANVHLETSATGEVLLFYRKSDGESTSYTHIATLSFPMELKIVRQGSVFTGYYRDKTGDWAKGASVIAAIGSEPLTGFYACSGSESQIGYSEEANREMEASFYDWTFDYQENFLPAEKDFTDTMEVKPGTLLRDNFDDGSLSNSPVSIINPVWNGIQYANLPFDPTGGRYWRKTGDGSYFLGDKKWADYQTGIDLTFDNTNKLPNEFILLLRYQCLSVYSKMLRYYAAGLREGNKLFFEKYESGNVVFSKVITIPPYFNGVKHNLKVRLLDRNYQVLYDNRRLIEGVDSVRPVTYGNISLKFTNAATSIDNLEVLRLEDAVNGAADNYLLDYFDKPLPAYLKKYGF